MSSRLSVLSCALVALVVATGCSRQEESTPCVATPSVTLARDRVAIGSPFKVTYTFDVAQNATIRRATTWCSCTCSTTEGERLWGDDHPPAQPTATWKAGAEGRVHADGVRAELPVHRRRRSSGSGSTAVGQPAACALRDRDLATRVRSRQVPAPAPVREHLPHISRMAGTPRKWRRRTRRTSGSGPRRRQPCPSAIRRRMRRSTSSSTPEPTGSRPPSRSPSVRRSGDRDVHRRLDALPSSSCCRCRPPRLGTADMTELTLDVDQTFIPGGGRRAGARHPGVPRLHRAEVDRLALPKRAKL